ncbi:type II pantothenate kinase [Paenibacillus silvisoli]|uniref:type II pantothenate kinase n=1 Tax=Paenibacillus silvisoli TaxID=3110539 RepID=UPI002804EC3C|nr:type II pantothenate kinase [Paenibacillus silvisoli]
MRIGIDVGGTLIKLAFVSKFDMEYKKVAIAELDAVVSWVESVKPASVCVTGGGAARLKERLSANVSEMIEFEATVAGANSLLGKNGANPQAFVLVNVGTGTSIHYVDAAKHRRIGGTGIGGGTLMGLSRLVTGLSNFNDIVSLAKQGVRERIDLTVSDIYNGAETPIPGHLTASNFAKLSHIDGIDRISKQDLLAAVVGMVGETVATASVLAAGQFGTTSIVYIGSSFIDNDHLRAVIQDYTVLRGAAPLFLEQGEYCGAIGALLKLDDR